MRVIVVGCSPAWPNPGGAQSGYLVESNGTRVLLDCGAGVLPRLRETEAWPRVDAIVITHFHLDHWGDLVPWTWGSIFGPGRELPKPALWLPPGGRGQLAAFGSHFGSEDMFERAFDQHEYAEREPLVVDGLELRATRVPHYDQQTFGFRVGDGRVTLAYSGDSAPSERLSEIGRDADLFLCEATLAESYEAGARGHLSADEALSAFHASGARRLVLIHRPAELALDDALERATDGDRYDL